MKNEKLKIGAVALTIIAVCGVGCGKREAPEPEETKTENPPNVGATDYVQQKVLSFNLEGLTDKGEKQWEVRGESAEAVSENEVRIANIVAKSYGNEAEATITADKGIYDKSKNNVKLEENVKATIENTQSLAKEYMDIPGELQGESNPKNSNSGSDKKTKTIVTCDGEVEFDYEKNLAFFNKNVKVVSEYGEIDADKITIDLEPKSKRIVDIVAEGNVMIKKGENITYSDKAIYIEAEEKVILTGKPKLVIYQEGEIGSRFSK